MRNLYRVSILSVVMLIIAACGNVATPKYEADRIVAEAEVEATHIIETAQAAEGQAVAEVPTSTPTEIPTEIPTEVPTEVPTEIPPTEVPTEIPTEVLSVEDQIMASVAAADPIAGEAAFQVQICGSCHQTTDLSVVGPGLADLYDRAGERVEGQGAYEYIFHSIRYSQEFVVEGYPAGVMLEFSEAQLSDQDIYNIMAYLKQFSN